MGANRGSSAGSAEGIRMLGEHEVSAAPPSKLLLALEPRAWVEFAALLLASPLLRRLPRGDGHPVLVLPGFGGSDLSTLPMRRLLRRLGYAVHGWEQGRNWGMRPLLKDALGRRLREMRDLYGCKISLIGWSLGGVYAREMARQAPEHVRQVITLGSPINGHYAANNVMPLFRLFNRGEDLDLSWESFQRRRIPPPVPVTAIYSRSDGIVAWRCAREEEAPHTDNVEVFASHLGLGVNPLALGVIADRLALPEAHWTRLRTQDGQRRSARPRRRVA